MTSIAGFARVLLLTLLTTPLAVAMATPLTTTQKNCLFKNPVLVGASITAQTTMSLPLYHSAISALAAARGQFFLPAFGPSPHRLLITEYGEQSFFRPPLADYSKMFTRGFSDLGSTQIDTLLFGDQRKIFDQATVLIGVDAFYWDAISGNCGYGSGSGAEETIANLIAMAKIKNVKLILGNVPQEDPSLVLIDSARLGIPGLWYAPRPACLKSINNTLASICVPENGCYLIDILKAAKTLNEGGQLKLKNGGSYGLFGIRPDGVHLSVHGSRYVSELMVDALEANPPQCSP